MTENLGHREKNHFIVEYQETVHGDQMETDNSAKNELGLHWCLFQQWAHLDHVIGVHGVVVVQFVSRDSYNH